MCFGLGILILIVICVAKGACEDYSESNHMRNMTKEERSEYVFQKGREEMRKKIR